MRKVRELGNKKKAAAKRRAYLAYRKKQRLEREALRRAQEGKRKLQRKKRKAQERKAKAAAFKKLPTSEYRRLLRVEKCVEAAILGRAVDGMRAVKKRAAAKKKERAAKAIGHKAKHAAAKIARRYGYRLKKNVLRLKTFCTLRADKIIDHSKSWGVAGTLLKAMAVKSKKSPTRQYAHIMYVLRNQNMQGIPNYVLRHIHKRMNWRRMGILHSSFGGKKTVIGISAKVLGFESNKLGLQKLDLPAKRFYHLMNVLTVKHRKALGGPKFDAKTFRALRSWKGNEEMDQLLTPMERLEMDTQL